MENEMSGTAEADLLRSMTAPARLSPTPVLPFRAAILAIEAGWVLESGTLVQAWHSLEPAVAAPAAMAAVYLGAALLTRSSVELPRSQAQTSAIRTLGTIFLVSIVLLAPSTLGALLSALLWFGLALGGIEGLRYAAVHLANRLPVLATRPRPVAFIGNSESAARMLRQLEMDPHRRSLPIGFFDDRNARPGPLEGLLPRLGQIEDLISYLSEHELHDVYMALPWSAGERISVLIHRLRFLPLTVRLIPDQVPPALRGHGSEQLDGVVLPTLMLPPFSFVGAIVKRSCDLVISGALLVPLAALFSIVAIIIKLDSRGPVFFRQARSGQYGRSFNIFKFRSLHLAQADSGAETLVSRGDDRVTRIGRYLRKYSIDELPQILNVVVGDMSLVGPRPHAPRAKADGRIYADVMPDYMLRYRVKPGMTGWAQVNGWRGNTDTEEKLRKRVEFDFAYIRSWSVTRDLEILLRTIPSVFLPPPSNI
jgi:Undecaprenyl-phosphate glucose phosphotransferase